MCRAQQLQCKSKSARQIIGAHQPHQACNKYTHVHCCDSTVATRVPEEGAHQLGQLSLTVRTPQPRDWGSLFNFSASGRGVGAQLLASRPDYMEFIMQATTEWKRGHILDILATVQPWEWG